MAARQDFNYDNTLPAVWAKLMGVAWRCTRTAVFLAFSRKQDQNSKKVAH